MCVDQVVKVVGITNTMLMIRRRNTAILHDFLNTRTHICEISLQKMNHIFVNHFHYIYFICFILFEKMCYMLLEICALKQIVCSLVVWVKNEQLGVVSSAVYCEHVWQGRRR